MERHAYPTKMDTGHPRVGEWRGSSKEIPEPSGKPRGFFVTWPMTRAQDNENSASTPQDGINSEMYLYSTHPLRDQAKALFSRTVHECRFSLVKMRQ